jgi:hypothetical protein
MAKCQCCEKESSPKGGIGCYKCEGVRGVIIHSIWCVNSDFCEAKRSRK